MIRSPEVRMSLGLMFITMSILLLCNFVGLIPDKSLLTMETRKSTAESLAVRLTYAAQDNKIGALRKAMEAIVELNPDILSLGMRGTEGRYRTQTRDHQAHWVPPSAGESTSTHWQVPIYRNSKQWGTLEVSFTTEEMTVVPGFGVSPFTSLLAFFAVVSFIGFIIFMKRSLRYLDPSSVIPSRVQYALDTLTEGVLLLDTKDQIMLANSVFAEKAGYASRELIGLKASQLDWLDSNSNEACESLPWIQALSNGEKQSGILLNMNTKPHGIRTFVVNSAPIFDIKGKIRGAVVTFDDVTELERQSFKLTRMVELLKMSKKNITQKNRELAILATQDSLTGCLNRRAFFETAENFMSETSGKGINLACIMADLDLFKSINDTYGHAIGDQVLKYFAKTLQSETRNDDVVCRYGGEEFCILLPHCNSESASLIIERVRREIVSRGFMAISEAPDITISASFGVSDLTFGAQSIEELIVQADKALYKAKLKGRNCVVCWDTSKEDKNLNKNEARSNDSSFENIKVK